MDQQLENILKDLEYDKVFIKTIDGYDNKYLNEFENWLFAKAYSSEKKKYVDIITFESCYAWNEQIVDTFLPIRKKCIQKYGYDIIPLDYDMCATFDFWNGKVNNGPLNQYWINKIQHVCKKHGIKVKYLMRGYGDNDGIIFWINKNIYRLSRKEKSSLGYLSEYFYKKYNMHIEAWIYYDILNS